MDALTNATQRLKLLMNEAWESGFIEACKWPSPVSQDVDSQAARSARDAQVAVIFGTSFRTQGQVLPFTLDQFERALADSGAVKRDAIYSPVDYDGGYTMDNIGSAYRWLEMLVQTQEPSQ